MRKSEGNSTVARGWVRTIDGYYVKLAWLVQIRCRPDLMEQWAVFGMTPDGYRVDLRRGFDSLREAERWITKLLNGRR